LQYRHIPEQVEGLEDHSHFTAEFVDIFGVGQHIGAVKEDLSAVGSLQQVDATQKCGFAAARGTDQADDVADLDFKIDVFQNFEAAEALLEIFDFEDGFRVSFRFNQPPW
jgi:hypothetical protein